MESAKVKGFSNEPSFNYPFVTAVLKGNSSKATNGGPFTLKGGNAPSGMLTTIFEGVMTAGYASTATDDAVPVNIVAAGYGH